MSDEGTGGSERMEDRREQGKGPLPSLISPLSASHLLRSEAGPFPSVTH